MPERFFGSKVYQFGSCTTKKKLNVINPAQKLSMGSNIATDNKDKQEKFVSG